MHVSCLNHINYNNVFDIVEIAEQWKTIGEENPDLYRQLAIRAADLIKKEGGTA